MLQCVENVHQRDYPIRPWNWACMCAYACPPSTQRTDELHWPDWDGASERQPLLKFSWQTEIEAKCDGDGKGWVGVYRKTAYIHVPHARLPIVKTHRPHFPTPLRKWHEEHTPNNFNQRCSWVQNLRMWNLKTSFISPLLCYSTLQTTHCKITWQFLVTKRVY